MNWMSKADRKRAVIMMASSAEIAGVHASLPSAPDQRTVELERWSRGNFAKAMPASSTIHVLQLLRELLAFVLLSYTVLIGALLLAGWTTYFLVLK
ncbi:uncharacterized protein LOC134369177 isoform X7 [Cynocephalus volans]|uniref:uncharacterized protein LOC134369177 isoform X7 n=1 Tax=Cynocephalus volans TaxID=110931 RepID=UPI002FCCA425